MAFLSFVLVLSECAHIVVHLTVLFQFFSIESFGRNARILYFSWDAVSSLFCYLFYTAVGFQKHSSSHLGFGIRAVTLWVLIHLTIHLLAVLQLVTGFPVSFSEAFEMAELNFNAKTQCAILLYTLGTFQDVLTHCINAIFMAKILSCQRIKTKYTH